MERGFVKLYRKFQDSVGFKNHTYGMFCVRCLLVAAYKKRSVTMGYKVIELEPGQFIFGRKKWSEYLNCSEKVIRNCVKLATKTCFIEASKRAAHYTIYSVVNWDIYQAPHTEEGQALDEERARQGPGRGQAGATIKEGSKNGNKVEDVKEVKPLPAKRPKKKRDTSRTKFNSSVWDAYADAYEKKYGSRPFRNASTNSLIARFTKKVPMELARDIAAGYVDHPGMLYVNSKHCLELLNRDANKIGTDWQAGKATTGVRSRMEEKTAQRMQTRDNLLKMVKEGKL
jgi:hypothetical protein